MAYKLQKITVLIVDENPHVANLMRSMLNTFGVQNVVNARNSVEALKLVRQYNPDIIFADWVMKPDDGIEFTYNLRHDPSVPNPFVPVILLSGSTVKRRVMDARDAGVTEFLAKPFTAQDVYKRLSHIIEKPRQFVRAPDFFGPDRRRRPKKKTEYAGPERRDNETGEDQDIAEDDNIVKLKGKKTQNKNTKKSKR